MLWIVIRCCQELQIAHNFLLCRSKANGAMRAVVWPRRSFTGPKQDADGRGYNVAVAELSGMMVVASENVIDKWDDKKYQSILTDECISEELLGNLIECVIVAQNNLPS